MTTDIKLDNHPKGKSADIKYYKSVLGNLLYLTINRSNILFVVGMCVRYQYCVRESHLTIVNEY